MASTAGVPGRRAAFGVPLPELVVFALAFAARLSMVYVRGGGLTGATSYDPSVYYAAADGLIHGRLPYRDFTLLHPPGMMLALTPFAAFGRFTTDESGFMLGNLAWIVLGAVNAVLVVRVARRMRLGTGAAVVGGLCYALCFESLRAEYLMRLEPLGNCLVLCGLLAYFAAGTKRWVPLLGGVALGAAASVKIWYSVPLVLVLGWYLVTARRQVLWAVAGAAGAGLVIDGPFLALTGRAMVRMVVTEQLFRRHSNGWPVPRRVLDMTSVAQLDPVARGALADTVRGAAVLVAVVAVVLAVRGARGRLPAVLLLVQLGVVVAAPSYYPFYTDYLMPAAALTLAAASAWCFGAVARRRFSPGRAVRYGLGWLPVVVALGLTVTIDLVRPMGTMAPAPYRVLARAVSGDRCVQSDSPMALIELDALSRDFAHGCRQWVDVTGRTYGGVDQPVAGKQSRATDPVWQHALARYLRSGQAFIVIQPRETGINSRTLGRIERGTVVGRVGGFVLRRTVPGTVQRRS
jgi:alpha-1,2-mannosyltransferase